MRSRTFVNFCRLSVLPGKLPSASINFPFGRGTFRHLSITFHASERLSIYIRELYMLPGELETNFINFPCGCGTFRELYMCPWDFRLLLSTFHLPSLSSPFCAAMGPSINYRQFFVAAGPSYFRAVTGPSINFSHYFVLPWDILSTSVNFPCVSENFCQLPSTFRVAAVLFISFRLLLMRMRDLLSTFHEVV